MKVSICLRLIFVAMIAQAAASASTLLPTILSPGTTVSPLLDFDDLSFQNNPIITFTETPFGSSAPTGIFATIVGTSDLNPFGSADTVFDYGIAVITGDVVQLSVTGFGGFQAAVKMSTDGLLVPALSVSRSSDGDTIVFDFAGIPGGGTVDSSCGCIPTAQTGALDIYTDAPSFTDPLVTITDASGSTAQFATLGPSAVPENSSMLTSAAGLILVFALVFKFRLSNPRNS